MKKKIMPLAHAPLLILKGFQKVFGCTRTRLDYKLAERVTSVSH
jgi:hypothetical protein